MDADKVETKLAAARTRLILDKPFLGALVLRMPLQQGDPAWCITAATNAKKIFYNYDYVLALTPAETQFVLAKQALHCALSHFARRQHRLKHLWDLACDYAVSPLLIDEGLQAPPGTFLEESYRGLSAEEIYPYLQDKDDGDAETGGKQEAGSDPSTDPTDEQDQSTSDKPPGPDPDDESDGGSSSDPQQDPEQEPDDESQGQSQEASLSQQELDNLSVQWQQRLAGAAQQAQQAGKLSEGMARMVELMLQPKLPWRALLARFMVATARDDYSYARPSSRRGGPAIFPSLRSSQVNIVVALDISGSISGQEIEEFMTEIDAIKGQLRARVSLLACDEKLVKGSPWLFEAWEEFKLPKSFRGGGGTDFRPVFDWIEKQDQAPELLVYFSDCLGRFPEHEPSYPVLWLVKGRKQPAFGQRVQLN